MAAEMVNMATTEKLKELDWAKSIEICELVTRDQGKTKDVIKAIKKRLGNKDPNTQLFAVMLLEMLMNNCGEHIHRQVIDNGLVPKLVKIVKKKTDIPVRKRIFLLLNATQTVLGGASGKFPQYYEAYYDLVSARVEFPKSSPVPPREPPPKPLTKSVPAQESLLQNGGGAKNQSAHIVPDSGIIDKARSVMDVLREVLSAVDPKRPEEATDEFILDLVEQCSFQKQRVMHLVITSGDEGAVIQAIELNEQLHKVLVQHDALLSVRASSTAPFANDEAEEKEDEERLYRRIRKGKACAEENSDDHVGTFRSIPEDKIRRPLIRPLSIRPPDTDTKPTTTAACIPPPPAKHVEREKFFNEKNMDGPGLASHIRGLSLHSRNGSSSRGGSTDFSDRDINGFRDC